MDEEIKEVEDEAVMSKLALEPSAERPRSVHMIQLSPLVHQSEPNIGNPNNINYDFDSFFRHVQERVGINESDNEHHDDEF